MTPLIEIQSAARLAAIGALESAHAAGLDALQIRGNAEAVAAAGHALAMASIAVTAAAACAEAVAADYATTLADSAHDARTHARAWRKMVANALLRQNDVSA